MKNSIFALVDCNNFYASCERVFDPTLAGRPIVILSNNDGCIVARSNQAKALGIPMAAPFFRYKALLERHQGVVFSSNYPLYADMSNRVMACLRLFTPDIEVYSIDEAFLRLDGFQHLDVIKYAKTIRQKIRQWTGLPISIGIAPNKTLAKVATHMAKRYTRDGVYDLRDPKLQEVVLHNFALEDIWGIASRRSKKLKSLGIHTALALRDSDPSFIRRHMSIVVERTLLELRGIVCLDLESVQAKKTIMSSRSFGKTLTQCNEIEQALAHYTARACEKLRHQHSRAQGIYVFLRTHHFSATNKQYSNSITRGFISPSNDSSMIIQAAKQCLRTIYQPGYQYKKTGIMLMDLIDDTEQQQDLFVTCNNDARDKLMTLLDNINRRMGSNSLFVAAQGAQREWLARADQRSPRYTTQWSELTKVF